MPSIPIKFGHCWVLFLSYKKIILRVKHATWTIANAERYFLLLYERLHQLLKCDICQSDEITAEFCHK